VPDAADWRAQRPVRPKPEPIPAEWDADHRGVAMVRRASVIEAGDGGRHSVNLRPLR